MPALDRLDLNPPVPLEQGLRSIPTTAGALDFLRSRGIPFMNQPTHIEVPLDLTSMSDDALGDLLNKIDQMCGYIVEQLAIYESAKNDAEAALKFCRVRIMVDMRGEKKMTISERDALLDVDPRVKAAQDQLHYSDKLYCLTRAVMERFQRHWNTVSRRITQRGQDIQRMSRGSAVETLNPQFGRTFRK